MKRQTLHLLAAAGLGAAAVTLVAGCASGSGKAGAPVPLASDVDIPRYMGAWYVIANIPTWPERGARDAVETYTQAPDGHIGIDFRYRKQEGDGELKRMGSKGFVSEQDKAIWGVQFVWPIKADYRIAYVEPDYSQTIVAREKRDYVWIMARTPAIPEERYQALVARVAAMGYDVSKLQRVPQAAR
jgi:apolipoprotein D and lipocalin family protein